jgi:hypothetical protein
MHGTCIKIKMVFTIINNNKFQPDEIP